MQTQHCDFDGRLFTTPATELPDTKLFLVSVVIVGWIVLVGCGNTDRRGEPPTPTGVAQAVALAPVGQDTQSLPSDRSTSTTSIAPLARGPTQPMADLSTAELSTVPSTPADEHRTARLVEGVDAKRTSWHSEAFAESAAEVLHHLADLLVSPSNISASDLADLTSDQFECSSLRPNERVEVHRDALTTVQRSETLGAHVFYRNAEAVQRVKSLAAVLGGRENAAVKLKIVSVESTSDNPVITRVYAEGRSSPGDHVGGVQWTANWECRWQFATSAPAADRSEKPVSERPPRLASIALLDYEEVATHSGTGRWLVDCADDLFRNEPQFAQQFGMGMDGWVNRLEQRLRVNRLGHHGLALGDVNGDGRDDIYVCHSGGLPNRLYIQNDDGTMRDVSHAAGVDFLDDSTCALVIDLDNDGDQDLVVATVAGGVVLSNEGDCKFQLRAALEECRNAFSLTAADYDRDGLLDLYVGRYWPTDEARGEIPIPVPFFDAQNGGRNLLYRNTGWKFDDVTQRVGLDESNTRYTMAAAWEDLDDDGDLDLYVANDFGRNCWYRNDDGQFSNLAADAGIEDIATGMSVSYADYDHDGKLDLYVSNMFSAAGNRVAYQRQYSERFDHSSLQKVQRLARGNSLFRNLGNGEFEDVSVAAGVTMGRWAWGSLFTDMNNDGWEDLIVMNGHLTTDDHGDL